MANQRYQGSAGRNAGFLLRRLGDGAEASAASGLARLLFSLSKEAGDIIQEWLERVLQLYPQRRTRSKGVEVIQTWS